MRVALILVPAAILIGCSEAPSARRDTAHPVETSAAAPTPTEVAQSGDDIQGDASTYRLGDSITIAPGAIALASGERFSTAMVWTGSALISLNANGQRYADQVAGIGDGVVELRAIIADAPAPDASAGLCAGQDVTFIAIVSDDAAANVSVFAFTGPDRPGEGATDSSICAVASYPAPQVIDDGALDRSWIRGRFTGPESPDADS